METYLTLLYLTLEQEVALKDFFLQNGWRYCKSDLSMITDQVGPAKTPASYRTTRAIISYNLLDKVDTSSPNSKATGRKSEGQKTKQSKITTGNCAAKVEKSMALDGSELPDSDESEPLEMSTEMDDGDNDDDFADALNDAMEETLEEQIGGSSNSSDKPVTSPVKLSKRPVRKILKTAIQRSPTEVPQDNDSTSIGSGRKRRKVAMEKDVKTEVLHGEKSENEEHVSKSNKDKSPLVDRQRFRAMLAEALRSSPSGKETARLEFSTCPYCEKSIRNTNMRRHILSHMDLPYRCTRCTMFFKTKAQQDAHNQLKHSTPHVCKYCEGIYSSKAALTEHIHNRHEGSARMYVCSVCGVKMVRKSHLDDHMNTHNDTNPYSCANCSRSYKNKSAFRRHSAECGSGIKHTCNLCGQSYKTAVGLKDHEKRAHDENHAFFCVCAEKFKTRAARCKHRLACETYKNQQSEHDYSVKDGETGVVVVAKPWGVMLQSMNSENAADSMRVDKKSVVVVTRPGTMMFPRRDTDNVEHKQDLPEAGSLELIDNHFAYNSIPRMEGVGKEVSDNNTECVEEGEIIREEGEIVLHVMQDDSAESSAQNEDSRKLHMN